MSNAIGFPCKLNCVLSSYITYEFHAFCLGNSYLNAIPSLNALTARFTVLSFPFFSTRGDYHLIAVVSCLTDLSYYQLVCLVYLPPLYLSRLESCPRTPRCRTRIPALSPPATAVSRISRCRPLSQVLCPAQASASRREMPQRTSAGLKRYQGRIGGHI